MMNDPQDEPNPDSATGAASPSGVDEEIPTPEAMERTPGAEENAAGDAPGDREPPAEEQVEKWRDVAARAQADLENYRKRMAREKTEAIQFANRALLESLLPVVDNFEMGLKAARAEGEGSPVYQGMSMVQRQLHDFLVGQGVTAIEPEGEKFDPNLHEALKQEPSETVPEGHVVAVVRPGYLLRERILRAANVIVSSGPGETESAG